ncbi:MAG TPA: glycosyl hydrolase family 8 [Candidatus Saccharimonadales bacterium]|nr:glycosyl hydrolase family 8 [Candidatus Saccharimonadales bacterium]
MERRLRLLGLFGIIIVMLVAGFLIRANRPTAPVSKQTLLNALWQTYNNDDWRAGRTIDPHGNVTTSEGQGYTMLRAVWSNDPKIFAETWRWTAQHLQRPDKLFKWRFSQESGSNNTASDADTDIALALVMAGSRWHNAAYLAQAKLIIPAIWQQEVVTINGQPYMTADQLEKDASEPILNPSYWAPYAYRIFGQLDAGDDWRELADQSYNELRDASQQQLDTDSSANLPPDWLKIDAQTGRLSADNSNGHDTNFGYDAFRAVWRVALDYQWNHDTAAKNMLASFSKLAEFWNHNHRLNAIYSHDGQVVVQYESPAMYGGALGYFTVIHPDLAEAIVTHKMQLLYNDHTHSFDQTVGYYENNWLWFGLALYSDRLPKFAPGGAQ